MSSCDILFFYNLMKTFWRSSEGSPSASELPRYGKYQMHVDTILITMHTHRIDSEAQAAQLNRDIDIGMT